MVSLCSVRSKHCRMDCELVIAGGGPVGLLTALICAESGIECRVFEMERKLGSDLRASSFHPPTIDMLDDIGIADALVQRGLVCPHWQIRIHPSGERAVFELASIAAETRHPFRLQCEQWKLSEELLARLQSHPHATVEFGSRVLGFTQVDNSVTVTIDRGGHFESVTCKLLVGADGLGSVIRHGLGLPFEGETFPETTIVVTTPFRFEDHLEGMSLVTSCYVGDSHIAFLRLPDRWRLALYPDESLPIEEQMKSAAIEDTLQRVVELATPYPVDAIWPYRVQQRIVPKYRIGRVALAGDAAHVNSPAGGMGLNAGIHDAVELATALIAILKDGAGKIVKTLQIAFFLTVGVIATHSLVITPLLIVLLLFTNDFVTMSVATDHVAFSQSPDRWNVRTLVLTGGILAAFMLIISFAIFLVGRDWLGLQLAELQTLVFVVLVATGQGNIHLVRERGLFWRSRPSGWLVASSLFDLLTVSVMATAGILMAPISLTLTILVFVVVVTYLVIIDQVKTRMYRRLLPA